MEKKRVIVDYSTITKEMMDALLDQYPDGFDAHIIRFKNAKGESIKAVPFETSSANYMVKIGTRLEEKLEAYIEESDDDDMDQESLESIASNADSDDDTDDD